LEDGGWRVEDREDVVLFAINAAFFVFFLFCSTFLYQSWWVGVGGLVKGESRKNWITHESEKSYNYNCLE